MALPPPARPSLVARVWPTAVALLVMLLACVAYFAPQLSGRVILSSDTVQSEGMYNEIVTYNEASGDRTLWTNSMFGGMPAYQLYEPERGNLLGYVEDVVHLGFDRPISYFFAIMLGLFVLLRVLGVNVWLSMVGAVAFGLGSNHMTLFEAGHMTKLRTISFMAPTLAGLVVLFRGRYLAGAALFALSLGLNIHANHPQMTYYLAAACGVFVVFRLVNDVQRGLVKRWATALAISLVCAALAVGASYSKISTTIEYGRDTMRGAPILAAAPSDAAATSSSQVKGLEWGYAMQWSNGVKDVLAGFIPMAAGGGGAAEVESDGPLATAIRRQNPGARLPPGFALPAYHGALPFTAGPVYYGAVLVYLFILGMFWLRPGWRYFFGASVLFTMLLSMGQNAAWLNRLLFDVVPFFNNFRAPSSATSVTALLVAAGAFAAVCQALRHRGEAVTATTQRVPLDSHLGAPAYGVVATTAEEFLRRFYIGTGIAAGLLLFVAFLGPGFFDFAGGSDAQLQQAQFPMDAVREERIGLLRGSALRSLGFVLATAALLWAFLTRKLGSVIVIAGLGVLAVADVWGVSRDYLAADDFQPKRQAAAQHLPRPVDNEILQDPDPHYRVLDLSVNTFNSASSSYFHKTIGGYHAAKLQRAQDLIDRHISRGNPAVLDMLNTKYVIQGQPGAEQVQRNPNAAGNAWFVETVRVVPDANGEIDALEGLDVQSVAIVHEEFADRLPARSFSGSGSITLTDYKPNRLTYRVSTDAQQLALFSEMWYGPDKGWHLEIDGTPAELLRANYALRAAVIPAGEHEVVMYFEPASFYRGELISYVASGIILLLCVGALVVAFRQNRQGRLRDANVESA